MLYTTASTIDVKKVVPAGAANPAADDNLYSAVVRYKGTYTTIQAGSAGDVTILNPQADTAGHIIFNNIPVEEGVSTISIYLDNVTDIDTTGSRATSTKEHLGTVSVMSIVSTEDVVEI